MEIIIHKINSIKTLKKIPNKFGTEIDIRAYKSNLILSHDPKKKETNYQLILENIIMVH